MREQVELLEHEADVRAEVEFAAADGQYLVLLGKGVRTIATKACAAK